MKYRLGFVIALGVGLFGQASALAQQPLPPPPPQPPGPGAQPAPPPADKPSPDKPPSDKPATPPADSAGSADAEAPPSDSVAGPTDPNTPPKPEAAEPTPNAPPAPPPAGREGTSATAPGPLTLPPYLQGGPQTMTQVPPPVPQTSPSSTATPPPGTSPDGVVKREKGDAYLRWRGTGINWNHSVSATALGLGSDYISSDTQQYTQGLSIAANFFLIEPTDAQGNKRGYYLRVQSSLGFDVELTNSNITTKKYEKQLRDVPISFVHQRTLWKSADAQSGISLNVNGTFILPTSPTTRGQGIYLAVNPRASLFFSVPLLGKDAPALKSVFLGIGTQYTHRFSEATTPTNPDIRRIRQSTSGSTFVSDQLTGVSLNSNNLRVGGFAFFGEKLFGKNLWIFVGGGASYQFVNTFESSETGCDLVITTGCTTAKHLDNPLTTRVVTDFGVGINFFPSAEWGVTLGYDNASNQLAPNGQRRNPFNSPNAQFSAGLLLSVDAIVERLEGNVREDPVIYF